MEMIIAAWFIFGAVVGGFVGLAVAFVLVLNAYEVGRMEENE